MNQFGDLEIAWSLFQRNCSGACDDKKMPAASRYSIYEHATNASIVESYCTHTHTNSNDMKQTVVYWGTIGLTL